MSSELRNTLISRSNFFFRPFSIQNRRRSYKSSNPKLTILPKYLAQKLASDTTFRLLLWQNCATIWRQFYFMLNGRKLIVRNIGNSKFSYTTCPFFRSLEGLFFVGVGNVLDVFNEVKRGEHLIFLDKNKIN